MKEQYRVSRPTQFPKPRDFLQTQEKCAVNIRRLLRHLKLRGKTLGKCGSMGDAVMLSERIEELCRYGRKRPAADAIEIAQQVEVLADLLVVEIDALFAP